MFDAFRTGAAIAALSLAGPAVAQLPFGPESQANSLTTYTQQSPVVAAAPDGTFLVAWSSDWSNGNDHRSGSVQLRRFGNAGGPLGSEFQVNQDEGYDEHPTRIHVNATGRFKVMWNSVYNGPCCFLVGGSGRRYRPDGSPMADEFVVGGTAEYSGAPSTAARPTGEFVAARRIESEIEVRRFDARGSAQGEFMISPATSHYLFGPAVAVAPGGEFVVAWFDLDLGVEPWTSSIRARRYAADASPVGGTIEVTGPGGADSPSSMSMARNADGELIVVWSDSRPAGSDTSGSSVQARSFDAQGLPLGARVQVNDLTLGAQTRPRVATGLDGGFVVVWQDGGSEYLEGGPRGVTDIEVRGRHLSADGTPRGSGFAVNSLSTGDQLHPDVAFLPGGNFVVVWRSDVSSGGDTDQTSVQLRRFQTAFFADGFESGLLSRWVQGGD
ncbi:MAG: hypothetical protein AMXMBFR36_23490 [Acidobacteriota bacterium]